MNIKRSNIVQSKKHHKYTHNEKETYRIDKEKEIKWETPKILSKRLTFMC